VDTRGTVSDISRSRQRLYDVKLKALLKVQKSKPELFKLYFIERGDRITYCEECTQVAYENWRNAGGYYTGFSFGQWLRSFYPPCPECTVEEDYYSLVEFSVETPVAKFCFHLPYPLVKAQFPKENLPKKKEGEEGIFVKYGREIRKYEALVVPLKEAMKKVREFLERN